MLLHCCTVRCECLFAMNFLLVKDMYCEASSVYFLRIKSNRCESTDAL